MHITIIIFLIIVSLNIYFTLFDTEHVSIMQSIGNIHTGKFQCQKINGKQRIHNDKHAHIYSLCNMSLHGFNIKI